MRSPSDGVLFAQLHVLEELLHELLGSAGGGLHQSLTQLLDLACVRCGNRDLCSLAALGLVCDVVNNVDNAGAVGHGDGDSADDAAVLGLQRFEHAEVITVLLIELGDVEGDRLAGGLE